MSCSQPISPFEFWHHSLNSLEFNNATDLFASNGDQSPGYNPMNGNMFSSPLTSPFDFWNYKLNPPKLKNHSDRGLNNETDLFASNGAQLLGYNPLYGSMFPPPLFFPFYLNDATDIFASHKVKRPTHMVTTGTSVVGIIFDDGVFIAADTLISYGALARYHYVDRVYQVNECIILGFTGDAADFQMLKRIIEKKVIDNECNEDSQPLMPKELFNWLARLTYNQGTQRSPIWLDVVIGGLDQDEPFLGHVNLRGRAYEGNAVTTGHGHQLALPLIRKKLQRHGRLTKLQAANVLHKCMEVMYYRDCRATFKYSVAVCERGCTTVEGPFSVDEDWQVANFVGQAGS